MNAALELVEQIDAKLVPAPEAIVLPVGSGGTLAGLHAGLSFVRRYTTLVGVGVAEGTSKREAVEALSKRTLRYAGVRNRHCAEYVPRVEVLDSYYGAGYAVSTDSTRRAAALLRDTEGIFVDQVYASKALVAFLDRATNTRSDRPLLFWNTSTDRGHAST
jgi:1-aminocyclopropane-1-carboxylate deaminase/D-cysteine desulfhydrase-like pyridoxal-dependent ACC family enzyme